MAYGLALQLSLTSPEIVLQAAALTDRAIVLPPIACDSPWVVDEGRTCSEKDKSMCYFNIPWPKVRAPRTCATRRAAGVGLKECLLLVMMPEDYARERGRLFLHLLKP